MDKRSQRFEIVKKREEEFKKRGNNENYNRKGVLIVKTSWKSMSRR